MGRKRTAGTRFGPRRDNEHRNLLDTFPVRQEIGTNNGKEWPKNKQSNERRNIPQYSGRSVVGELFEHRYNKRPKLPFTLYFTIDHLPDDTNLGLYLAATQRRWQILTLTFEGQTDLGWTRSKVHQCTSRMHLAIWYLMPTFFLSVPLSRQYSLRVTCALSEKCNWKHQISVMCLQLKCPASVPY